MEKNEKQTEKNWKERLSRWAANPIVVVVCDLCTIAGFILALVFQNNVIKIILFSLCTAIILYTVIFISIRWFSINRAKRNIQQNYHDRVRNMSKLTHIFFHELRDYNNYLKITETIKDSEFHDKAVNICNSIESFFTSVLETKSKTCVCIKLLDIDSISNHDYKTWKTYTFARSASTDTRRYNDDDKREPITENTDFEILVSNEKEFSQYNYFHSVNLEKTSKQFLQDHKRQFLNSHHNATYKSTIIVPIRILTKLASPQLGLNPKTTRYHILGFLCIDSEETFDEDGHNYRYNTFMNSIQFACAFADSLYHFFESYLLKRLFDEGIKKELNAQIERPEAKNEAR